MTKSPRTVVARLENDQLCIHYKDYCLNISDMLLTSRTFDERRMHSKSIDLEQFIDNAIVAIGLLLKNNYIILINKIFKNGDILS